MYLFIFLHYSHKLSVGLRESINSRILQVDNHTFECAVCGFRSSYKNSLSNHIEAKHSTGVYICSFCQKSCNSKVALTMHIRRLHSY